MPRQDLRWGIHIACEGSSHWDVELPSLPCELKVKKGLNWLEALPPEEISWLWSTRMQDAHKENKRHLQQARFTHLLTPVSIQNILGLMHSHWTHWLLGLLKIIPLPHIVYSGIPQPFLLEDNMYPTSLKKISRISYLASCVGQWIK